MTAPYDTAVCCFCGKMVPMEDAASLTIQPRLDSEESQHLFAHRTCLRAHVVPDIALITELLD
jgi:hypothetical protein